MSCWLSRASLRNFALCAESAGQGGMVRAATCCLMAAAQRLASS